MENIAPSQSPADQQTQQPHGLYVAFAGGGAKGVSHAGVLGAVEELVREGAGEFEVRGYSGTSAGAIVAALAAAGLRSTDLFEPHSNGLLGQINTGTDSKPRQPAHAGELLGRPSWCSIQFLRCLAPHAPAILLTMLGVFFLGLFWAGQGEPLAVVLIAPPVMALVVAATLIVKGVANLKHLRRVLIKLLDDRMGGASATFAEASRRGWVPLKIVAANVSESKAMVFSVEQTPSTHIADAVASSICIPFLFQPWRVRDEATGEEQLHIDGGVISNLPAWAFESEREFDLDSTVISAAVTETTLQGSLATTKSALERWKYAFAVVKTAIFGAESAMDRVRLPHVSIKLTVDAEPSDQLATNPIKLLSFDAPKESIRGIIEATYAHARTNLRERILTRPLRQRDFAELVHLQSQDILQPTPPASGGPAPRLRVSIVTRQSANPHAWYQSTSVGFTESDPDYAYVLPHDGSIAGRAFGVGTPLFMTRSELQRHAEAYPYRTAAMRRRTWSELSWAYAIPLPAREDMDVQLILDGNTPLDDLPPDVLQQRLVDAADAALEVYPQFMGDTPSDDPGARPHPAVGAKA